MHLLANAEIRESLEDLQQFSLAFVQSSKYAQVDVVQRNGERADSLHVHQSLPNTLPQSRIKDCSSSQSHFGDLSLVGSIDRSLPSSLPSQSNGSPDDWPSVSHDSVSPLLVRQLSSGSGNDSLSYLSTPESPYVKEGRNPEDSFNHSMFVVRGGMDRFDPRASLSELKTENTLTRP